LAPLDAQSTEDSNAATQPAAVRQTNYHVPIARPYAPPAFNAPRRAYNLQVGFRIEGFPARGACSIKNQDAPRRVADALSYGLETAAPYEKQGFAVRDDFWGGTLYVGKDKAIVISLEGAREYWFWIASDVLGDETIFVHIYDAAGRLAEAESWQKSNRAGARVFVRSPGTYYLIIGREPAPRHRPLEEKHFWALIYASRG
jgi:hypothetical protein